MGDELGQGGGLAPADTYHTCWSSRQQEVADSVDLIPAHHLGHRGDRVALEAMVVGALEVA